MLQGPSFFSNLSRVLATVVNYNPGSIAANTVAADGSAVTIPGVRSTDLVIPFKPTVTAGLAAVGARVTGDSTVVVTFANDTAAPIDAAAENWAFLVFSPDQSMNPGNAVT